MYNEHKGDEGCNQMHPYMMEMMGCCPKEFMAAKLEKKTAMLKIELEFVEKVKKILEKSDLKPKKK
jgi:hypothetical protein